MRRTRYQQGHLTLAERKRGRKTWEYRWWETGTDGKRSRRCLVVGTLQDYPTEALAQRALDPLRKDINVEHPRSARENMTMGALIDHYIEKEMGNHSTKTVATCVTYHGYFRKWIKPRWRDYVITNVKAVVVEEWLRSLPLANGSKAKIRNIMHALFRHAIRWDWIEQNPITPVRQSAKRREIPAILDVGEIEALLSRLTGPTYVAVFVAVFTGLRVGELLALKWSDVNFEVGQLNITRSITLKSISDCKTEASRKPVPLDLRVAEILLAWRRECPYPGNDDWIFASPHLKGEWPYWPGTLYRAHLKPAAKAAGITSHIGWHTFRRTYATLLKANGEDVKTVQELMRHANYWVTMNLYAQAITQNKRDAQSRVVNMLLGEKTVETRGSKSLLEHIGTSRFLPDVASS
jgi:integrase